MSRLLALLLIVEIKNDFSLVARTRQRSTPRDKNQGTRLFCAGADFSLRRQFSIRNGKYDSTEVDIRPPENVLNQGHAAPLPETKAHFSPKRDELKLVTRLV
jgi:hypothetical protein